MIAVAADLVVPLFHVLRIAAHQPALVHDQHAEPVAGVEQFRRGRIVRGANGVAAEFLQFFHAEFLQRIRDGRADAGVVLVIAGAVKLVMLAVQQKAVRRVKAHGADAEGGFFLVNHFAVHGNGRDKLVKFWRFPATKEPAKKLSIPISQCACDSRFNFSDPENCFSDLPSGEMISQFTIAVTALVSVLSRVASTWISAWPRRHVVLEFRADKNPVRRDGHRRGLVQPDVTVDARAFVKPALGFRRVHAHGDGVLAAEMHHVRDVLAERIVTALVMPHAPAVDPHRRVAEHAVERQPDAFA